MSILESVLAALLVALAQAAPYVVLGYLIAALVREFVSVEALTAGFGRDGLGPVARAVSVGALLPICSCGVIPLGVGLVRGGAAVGTTLAFMFAAPAISPVAVLLAWNILGPALTGCYVAAVLTGALGLGLVGNRCAAAPLVTPAPGESLPAATPRPLRGRLGSAARWAFWDLGAEVSVDLLVGLAIAATLLTLLPVDLVQRWLGQPGLMSLIAAVLVAIPAYTCTVPSIPVVRSLLLLGVSPGAALALLIAGPATNLGEVNVIRAQLGARSAAGYVGAIVLSALTAGLIVDRVVFPDYRYQAIELAGELLVTSCCVPMPVTGEVRPDLARAFAAVPGWHAPFAAVLAVTLVVGLSQRARRALRAFSRPVEGSTT